MIYNPAYYFNDANKNRKQAMDVLLLTQGWRCYLWNENELKDLKNGKQLLSDDAQGSLVRVSNKKYKPKVQALMTISTDESEKRIVFTDSIGKFILSPSNFVKGRWNYLKRIDPGNEEYTIMVQDHFSEIAQAGKILRYNIPIADEAIKENEIPRSRLNTVSINLNEVTITSKKPGIFRDKYMGRLDSLAKLDGNTDYVCEHFGKHVKGITTWLNVPTACHGARPIEGQQYVIWTGTNPPPSAHGFTFGGKGDEFAYIIYRYPKFTEEELLKKYRLTRIKAYYEKREFYQPDYDKVPDPLPDYRNTLLWVPDVLTDVNGTATLTFFNSDINSRFIGTVEGVTPDGLLGKKEFYFNVVK